jgi:hypothetical protein
MDTTVRSTDDFAGESIPVAQLQLGCLGAYGNEGEAPEQSHRHR